MQLQKLFRTQPEESDMQLRWEGSRCDDDDVGGGAWRAHAVLQAEELYRAPTAEQLVERKHEREEAARRASLVKVRTSQKSLGDIQRGLSEKVLFRKGSPRARGGEEWVKKVKREEVRCL
jgi:hypothetical protein